MKILIILADNTTFSVVLLL